MVFSSHITKKRKSENFHIYNRHHPYHKYKKYFLSHSNKSKFPRSDSYSSIYYKKNQNKKHDYHHNYHRRRRKSTSENYYKISRSRDLSRKYHKRKFSNHYHREHHWKSPSNSLCRRDKRCRFYYRYNKNKIKNNLYYSKTEIKSNNFHFKFIIGDIINHKYKIFKLLGDGAFGRVLLCQNLENNIQYAIKVIKPVQRYIDSGKVEAEILYDIKKKDIENKSHCMKIIESFLFEKDNIEYLAIVTEKLGFSLYDYIKMNEYHGFPLSQIRLYAKEILEGVNFLHKNGLIDSDLKPENILFSTTNYTITTNPEKLPLNVIKKSKNMKMKEKIKFSENKPYYIPSIINNDLKIIDFGGVIYKKDNKNDMINTRQYRAPEDILQCSNWDEKSDIWSIACIIYELYSGEVLFPTHDDQEHLCMIEKICGNFPNWMISKGNNIRKIFNLNNNCINYNYLHKKHDIIKAVDNIIQIEDSIPNEHFFFKDFLQFLLQVDPNKRPNGEEALKHSFFSVEIQD